MVLGLSSCNDTMDDKADVEAGWTVLPAPTATVAVSATTFSDATITLVASDTVNIAEYGVQYATSEDFSDGVFSAAETISKDAVEISISNLAEKTKYYIRPYVITLNGNTVFGDEWLWAGSFGCRWLYNQGKYDKKPGASHALGRDECVFDTHALP